jgi:hypothetical protein
MDPARQAALVAADPSLEQEVAQVAAAAPSPDPTYVPPGLDEPQAMIASPEESTPVDAIPANNLIQQSLGSPLSYPSQAATVTGSGFAGWPILLILLAVIIWLVFFKRWTPSRA